RALSTAKWRGVRGDRRVREEQPKSAVRAEPGVLGARPPDVDVSDRARVQPPERRRPGGAGKRIHAVAEMPAVQAVEGRERILRDDDADVFGDPGPRRDVVDPAQ